MLSIDIHYCFSKVLPEYCTQISKPTFRLPLKVQSDSTLQKIILADICI